VDRFKDKTTAYNLWEAIKAIYGKTSLETIARYFNKLIEINYNLFKNTNKYISYIQSSVIYLKDLGHALPEPFIAILLFKGLSSSFDSFSSCKYKEITNELKRNKTSSKKTKRKPLIDISRLISDIISEKSRISTNKDSIANRASNNKPICRHYNKESHIIDKYWKLHPELKNSKSNKGKNKSNENDNKSKDESTKAVMSALAYNSGDLSLEEDNKEGHMTPELILDSGASEHYIYNRD
jgi:gag-polypeptide of LTR copia-type